MEPFKNMIGTQVAEQTAKAILRTDPSFPKDQFLKNIKKELEPLELKARVKVISQRLDECLKHNKKKNLKILTLALKQSEDDSIGLSGFAAWPVTDYVATYGIEEFDASMEALKAMTKVFTAEFAVRDFFIKDQKKTLEYFNKWVEDESEHVRRLVSEGSRPLLPWGQKLHRFVEDPKHTWHLLEKLKNDESLYVRKSVANHLNDHSKNHPDFVIDKLTAWSQQKKISKELDWVIKHATRTLIKKGHSRAFKLHGVDAHLVEVKAQKLLTKKIKLGESLKVEVVLVNNSKKAQKFILDHEVHLLKANNKHNVKCFKGIKLEIKAQEKKTFTLSVPLKAVTTRTYYSGKHFWNSKLNGVSLDKLAFTLET